MSELFFRISNEDRHEYPNFLPYNPDGKSDWQVEDIDIDEADNVPENFPEMGDYEGLSFYLRAGLDKQYSIYRNIKTKRLLNTEDAFVLNAIDKSWRDPARNGAFSGIHWRNSENLRYDGWMQSDCAYSEAGYSPGYNEAAFGMIEEYLEQSPWKEEEDYNYYFIKGNGGVKGLYLRGWDNDKQEPTDFIRWWMNSDVVNYLQNNIGMARYDELDGWDENLFENPKQNFTADFNPEDEEHYCDYVQKQYRYSLQWAFDQDWWNVEVDDLDDNKKDEIVNHLQYDDLMVDAGNNEYFVAYQYHREQALNWFSPIVAAMFGYLKPLEITNEDDFLPELSSKYPNRNYALNSWRKFYKICLQLNEPLLLCEVARILDRGVPLLPYGIKAGAKQWPTHKIVAMTEELTALLTDMVDDKYEE